MDKNEEEKYERTEKVLVSVLSQLGNVLSCISVDKVEDGRVYISYKPSGFYLKLTNGFGIGISEWDSVYNLSDIDSACDEIVNTIVEEKIASLVEVADKRVLSGVAEWLQGREKKYGELVDYWKKEEIYEQKISELSRPFIVDFKNKINSEIKDFEGKNR